MTSVDSQEFRFPNDQVLSTIFTDGTGIYIHHTFPNDSHKISRLDTRSDICEEGDELFHDLVRRFKFPENQPLISTHPSFSSPILVLHQGNKTDCVSWLNQTLGRGQQFKL
jgi:hypothetical protein